MAMDTLHEWDMHGSSVWLQAGDTVNWRTLINWTPQDIHQGPELALELGRIVTWSVWPWSLIQGSLLSSSMVSLMRYRVINLCAAVSPCRADCDTVTTTTSIDTSPTKDLMTNSSLTQLSSLQQLPVDDDDYLQPQSSAGKHTSPAIYLDLLDSSATAPCPTGTHHSHSSTHPSGIAIGRVRP